MSKGKLTDINYTRRGEVGGEVGSGEGMRKWRGFLDGKGGQGRKWEMGGGGDNL